MSCRGLPALQYSNTVICDVHSYYFECSGQPAQFYVYSLYITCSITILYILCNIYNLMWLSFPCFGKLSRLMSTYKANLRLKEGNDKKTDEQILGDLYYCQAQPSFNLSLAEAEVVILSINPTTHPPTTIRTSSF